MRVVSSGRYMAWEEPIQDIPWFGQIPYNNSYYGGGGGQQMMYGGAGAGGAGMPYGPGMQAYPQQQYMAQPGGQAPYVLQQIPGHSLLIQPSPNGGAPTFTQVPSSQGMPV